MVALDGEKASQEIERRFLARVRDEAALAAAPARRLEQGYLTAGDPAVRVRRDGEDWIFTVKAGKGLVRREVEAPLPARAGAELLELCGAHRLAKRRHVLGRWEIDTFEGALAGLVVAEAELRSADEPLPPAPGCVDLLREVTEERELTSQALAALAPAAAAALVARLYGVAV